MPRVGFELTFPVFKRAKTFHALDREATVIGQLLFTATAHVRLQVTSIRLVLQQQCEAHNSTRKMLTFVNASHVPNTVLPYSVPPCQGTYF
jgi:hypothetical protein